MASSFDHYSGQIANSIFQNSPTESHPENSYSVKAEMAQIELTIAIILAVLAVVLIGISTIIPGAISTKFSGSLRSKLSAISAISGLSIIIAAAAAVLGIFYVRSRSSGGKNTAALGITFLILTILAFLMYITVIGLTLGIRGDSAFTSGERAALTASLIMTSLGLISLVVAAILFFTLTRGKSGSEAYAQIRYQRRSGESGMVSHDMASHSTASMMDTPTSTVF